MNHGMKYSIAPTTKANSNNATSVGSSMANTIMPVWLFSESR